MPTSATITGFLIWYFQLRNSYLSNPSIPRSSAIVSALLLKIFSTSVHRLSVLIVLRSDDVFGGRVQYSVVSFLLLYELIILAVVLEDWPVVLRSKIRASSASVHSILDGPGRVWWSLLNVVVVVEGRRVFSLLLSVSGSALFLPELLLPDGDAAALASTPVYGMIVKDIWSYCGFWACELWLGRAGFEAEGFPPWASCSGSWFCMMLQYRSGETKRLSRWRRRTCISAQTSALLFH